MFVHLDQMGCLEKAHLIIDTNFFVSARHMIRYKIKDMKGESIQKDFMGGTSTSTKQSISNNMNSNNISK